MNARQAYGRHLTLAVAGLGNSPPAQAQPEIHEVRIENVELIVANQNCQNWCWAASSEMLARSQGISNVPQEEFVRRIYAPHLPASPTPPASALPCLPTFGSFEPIKRAIEGVYTRPDGRRLRSPAPTTTGCRRRGRDHPLDHRSAAVHLCLARACLGRVRHQVLLHRAVHRAVHRDRADRSARAALGRGPAAVPWLRGGSRQIREINGTFELLVVPGDRVIGRRSAGGGGEPGGGGQHGGGGQRGRGRGGGGDHRGGVHLPGGVVLPGWRCASRWRRPCPVA